MSDQNDTQPSVSEPSAVAHEEAEESIVAAAEAALPPVESAGTESSVVASDLQEEPVVDDDEDGDELPLGVTGEGIQSLSERFNARAEIEDDLQRAENEMSYLREQVRQDPTVLAAVQEQQSKLEYIANTSFDLSEKVAELSKTVAVLSVQLQKVSEETEQTAAWSASTKLVSPLSKTFLVLAIVVLVVLLAGVGYLATNQMQLQQRQDKLTSVAMHSVEAQEKRMAAFDQHFADLVGTEIKHERESISKESIQSKLNHLRGGAVEQRLLRKSNGDWLLPKGKTEELITDHDLIEQLNQMFEKSGRSLTTHPSLPPHKVVSILKPNGKGGTDLMVTKETVP
ncbi:MAG: hypothetical protein LWW87_02120 [Geobacteraceae bacterium]|nr:hypothetical protein [Geobacteraceae bacterium]